MRDVTVIDYGVGNLLSVSRALQKVGATVSVTSDPVQISSADRLVLPGVGAFEHAMTALSAAGLPTAIKKAVGRGSQLLGICLGMQLLFNQSEEFGEHRGLDLVPGKIVRIPDVSTDNRALRIPHIGWSTIEIDTSHGKLDNSLTISGRNYTVYFVHSYMACPSDSRDVAAWCQYGGHKIPAVISKNNVHGCQFHPEKSGEHGLQILKQYVSL